uniref:Kelch-like protein 3 n=1 Tax=Mesocestoides corti TaxID=53468 RepID=A0A5K3F9Q0_MESCO
MYFFVVNEWRWADLIGDQRVIDLCEGGKSVVFHPISSQGTAVVRGTKPLASGFHYWELKVLSPVYGTDIMFGVGSLDVDLSAYLTQFVSFLGIDEKSWGLSYRGQFQHCGKISYIPGGAYTRGDIVSCLLDMWHKTLTFFVNRVAITDPISLPFGSYYPMVCSTAARSGFRLIFSKSYDISLQILTCISLQNSLRTPSILFDLPGFPPGLQSFLRNNLPWLFFMSRRRQKCAQVDDCESSFPAKKSRKSFQDFSITTIPPSPWQILDRLLREVHAAVVEPPSSDFVEKFENANADNGR